MCSREEILERYRSIYKKEDGVFAQLKKEHGNNPFTVNDHIEKNSKICFIFSCPGQEELIYGKVCYGETGEKLDLLLRILKESKGDIFTSTCRYDYDILNASDVVHFYTLDGKTEAGASEIKDKIKRIYDYIDNNKNLSHIIMFGKKAESLYKHIEKNSSGKKLNIKLIRDVPHLSYQSLNQIGVDIHNNSIDESHYSTPEERTSARLCVVAQKILSQL